MTAARAVLFYGGRVVAAVNPLKKSILLLLTNWELDAVLPV